MRHPDPHIFKPWMQRAGIMGILTKNEERVLLAEEIANVLPIMSVKTVYRRLGELQERGWVERFWLWNMPKPRFGVSDDANERLKEVLLGIVKAAGPGGIKEAEADKRLLDAVVKGRALDFGGPCPKGEMKI